MDNRVSMDEIVGATHEAPSPGAIYQYKHRESTEKLNEQLRAEILGLRNAEEAQVKAGPLQTAIFNSSNFLIIATDSFGVIQVFNVGAERMSGYLAAEVTDKFTPADFSDPEELIVRASALSDELDTIITPGFEELVFKASRGIEDIYEITYIRKDGSRLPAVVSVTALRDDQGLIIGYLLIGTDNTARKQVEAEQQRLDTILREKNVELEIARSVADMAKSVAEKANLAKSDFLSSMSHELRTPLNAILGFAQLLETAMPPPTPSQKRGVSQILKAGWYLLELINEILDLSLIESGKLSLSMEPVSLADIMNECRTLIEPQSTKYGISKIFPQFSTPCFVRADKTRLKQVLINLLSNAIKYNREGGTVVISYAEVSSGHLRISVQDTGYGLPPDKLGQLFQPFNRLGQEFTNEEGTGIGLMVSKRLVELMSGKIGVDSSVGIGSTFWFELKLSMDEILVTDGTPMSLVLPNLQSNQEIRTLLYVEDNDANQMVVEELISRRPDLRLLSATDGKQGVEMAMAYLPDLILMDINLPGINGITALGILAHNSSTAQIPIIALSANAMPHDIEKGLEAGFFRYLTKPIKMNEFMDTLDTAIDFLKTQPNRAE